MGCADGSECKTLPTEISESGRRTVQRVDSGFGLPAWSTHVVPVPACLFFFFFGVLALPPAFQKHARQVNKAL